MTKNNCATIGVSTARLAMYSLATLLLINGCTSVDRLPSARAEEGDKSQIDPNKLNIISDATTDSCYSKPGTLRTLRDDGTEELEKKRLITNPTSKEQQCIVAESYQIISPNANGSIGYEAAANQLKMFFTKFKEQQTSVVVLDQVVSRLAKTVPYEGLRTVRNSLKRIHRYLNRYASGQQEAEDLVTKIEKIRADLKGIQKAMEHDPAESCAICFPCWVTELPLSRTAMLPDLKKYPSLVPGILKRFEATFSDHDGLLFLMKEDIAESLGGFAKEFPQYAAQVLDLLKFTIESRFLPTTSVLALKHVAAAYPQDVKVAKEILDSIQEVLTYYEKGMEAEIGVAVIETCYELLKLNPALYGGMMSINIGGQQFEKLCGATCRKLLNTDNHRLNEVVEILKQIKALQAKQQPPPEKQTSSMPSSSS